MSQIPALGDHSSPPEWAATINSLNTQIQVLKAEIDGMKGHKEKVLKDMKSFSDVPVWDGSERPLGIGSLNSINSYSRFHDSRYSWSG